MEVNGNTVVITGGATGIGLALAQKFVGLGNKVIICGRREYKLNEAKAKLPSIHVKKCDISKEDERKALYDWVSSNFKDVNMLVNNAGIQRTIDFRKGIEDLLNNEDEIEINLKAQIYLSAYFIPIFLRRKKAAIINVSSGLGFVPLARFPVYCATKAAIHSFSMTLRYQLRETPIRVFEVIPPTVFDTELKGKELEKAEWNVPSSEVADAVAKGLENNEYEIAIAMAKNYIKGSRSDPEQAFKNMNVYST